MGILIAMTLDPETAKKLSLQAADVFKPRSPITIRELFAGRWEQLKTVGDAVSQVGLHIVIFGEPGVGKTSLANVISPVVYVLDEGRLGKGEPGRLVVKVNVQSTDNFSKAWIRAFDEISWVEERPQLGFANGTSKGRVSFRAKTGLGDSISIDDVRKSLCLIPKSVFIFDEFDRGPDQVRKGFTDLIKVLSDYAIASTIVIVGVSDTVDGLIRDHASIGRSVIQIQLLRMCEDELKTIIKNASTTLGVEFSDEASSLIVRMSQGLPHYTHLIGLHATRRTIERLSKRVELSDVRDSLKKAASQAIQSITDKYLKAVHSAHKDALYDKVILACACASSTKRDALGYFHPVDVVAPLSEILDRPNVTIATFQKHMNEFASESRGFVLQRFGMQRSYKYRFSDPLLIPYIFMKASSDSKVDAKILERLSVER